MCETFHCLPRQGGLLDQDHKLVRGMQLVLDAQAERAEKERKEQDRKAKTSGGRR